jgi:chaperone required for assembly of F1-ATPase
MNKTPFDAMFRTGEERQADPMLSARSAMRPALPKRFWSDVAVGEQEGGYTVLLDGRPIRTPARKAVIVPARPLAEWLAGEWRAVQDNVDPTRMPGTRLANAAIDGVAGEAEAVIADAARYAGSDLIMYRAEEPLRLVEQQAVIWNPILAWFKQRFDVDFHVTQGIIYVAQPPEALAAVAQALSDMSRPFGLAAVHAMTTLTGSVLIALAVAGHHLTPEAAWKAAYLDEDVQMEIWGRDEEALAKRDRRLGEFMAAAFFATKL